MLLIEFCLLYPHLRLLEREKKKPTAFDEILLLSVLVTFERKAHFPPFFSLPFFPFKTS